MTKTREKRDTLEAPSGPCPPTILPWFTGSVEDAPEEAYAKKRPPPPPPVTRPGEKPPVMFRRESVTWYDEGEIARGGMGAIRRLYDPELRRHLAMKVMDPALESNADLAQRFVDEARITGGLDHPNVVPVHDMAIDSHGGASYTMKLIHGQTLADLIGAQKTQRHLEEILQALLRVCDALAFAHSRGIIHRDLKPDNIMVGSFGQVYVMDWGCAQVIGDNSIVDGRLDRDGTVMGTVAYMAPEQAQGQVYRIDARTDVFALGAILYKTITGSPPYPGPVALALARARACEIDPPEQLPGAVKPPPHLSRIAMTAMARDPAGRYQSVQQFADELREFLRGGNWFPLHEFAPGAIIVREGDRADCAYIITAGRCEVRKAGATLRTLGAGDVFGETAIFADTPRSATVVAIEQVTAVAVDRGALDNLVRSSWLGIFVKALADRFLDLDRKLAEKR